GIVDNALPSQARVVAAMWSPPSNPPLTRNFGDFDVSEKTPLDFFNFYLRQTNAVSQILIQGDSGSGIFTQDANGDPDKLVGVTSTAFTEQPNQTSASGDVSAAQVGKFCGWIRDAFNPLTLASFEYDIDGDGKAESVVLAKKS